MEEKKEITASQKKIFILITLLIPLFFFILLELSLRLFEYGGDQRLFIEAPGEYASYMMLNPEVNRRYFLHQKSIPSPRNDIFLKEKPENGYRIFILGGSTAAGFPYSYNLMFSRIIHLFMKRVFPEKRIEVINTATSAINSYTLLDFTDEILDYEPDLILIYAGHNEYYGALGVASAETVARHPFLTRLYLKLKNYKTFLLIRDAVGWVQRIGAKENSQPSATLMERLVAEQTIPYKSALFEAGLRQFRKNMQDIIEKIQDAGVPLVLSELVSNVSGIPPFVSVKNQTFPAADSLFRLAQKLEDMENFTEAKKKYYLAKDMDGLRFRAPEEINVIIHQLAEANNLPLVPMKRYFEDASPHGIPGNNLFLEHLHPNIRGYFLMARAFLETMKTKQLVSKVWRTTLREFPNKVRKQWGYTELDSLYGDLRIRILKGGWPFKPKTAPNKMLTGYKPETEMDKLVYKIWADDTFGIEHGHAFLAGLYEKAKDYEKALREYRALIYLTPFNASAYIHTADMFIKMKRFNEALPLLSESLHLHETTYANKWVGQILLEKQKVKAALPFLKKAAKQNPRDVQTLYNLSGAYALIGAFAKADSCLSILESSKPDFPGAADLRAQLDRVLN
ncbi:MAG TPA: tetratricopeptide repeat protein [Caldithrix abyssi]|uniref:Tetratricopeptide repeat protein n=1 Tax=Caldithrix abyssi TaxID=187145 RepID=A0A7V4U590_CALAY|nr:tetratricopeptide repeat protein [Caldithrix abyssi]